MGLQGKISFSRRTGWDLTENRLAAGLRKRRAEGLPIADLTASNPTRCGLEYDATKILPALHDVRALDYDPDPRGWLPAREAVCRYYADLASVSVAASAVADDAGISPQQVVLTTSTSEAYSFLFRLLCDPGDEVLIMQPSYPLFDFLADLDDVRLVPYALIYDHGWQLDVKALMDRLTPRTRAIVLVHPNNPTGHFIKGWEREALESICVERGLALIVDEVFLDYAHLECGRDRDELHQQHEARIGSFTSANKLGPDQPLTFVLSGLSKIAGLPQMKAAWIVCLGPEASRSNALGRLEMIADTFLSMNAPVQCALPVWLAGRGELQQQIQRRVSNNLAVLDQLLATQLAVSRLRVEAGWYAVLRIPALYSDEETALQLLDAGVWTQPGSYYGFPPAGWLVISLLTVPGEFIAGVRALVGVLNG